MNTTMKTAAALAVAAGVMATAACGGSSGSGSSATSSTAAAASGTSASGSPTGSPAAPDHRALLIDAADIVIPGDTFTAQEPTKDPGGNPGAATVFSNAADTREVGDTILVLPDAAAAATALQGATGALGSSVVGGTPAPASIGTDSVIVSGTSPDQTKSVTVLLFTQGNASTTIEFDSGAEDPVPPEVVADIAQKQAQKIAAGLK